MRVTSMFSDGIWNTTQSYVLQDFPARQSLPDNETERSPSLRQHTTSTNSSTTWTSPEKTNSQVPRSLSIAHNTKTERSRIKDISIWPAATSSVILLINIIFLFVVLFATREKGPDGFPAFRPQTCEATSRWSQGLHYLINLLSTILLWASTYHMQRLSACTRSEIDMAHQIGSWVDVGVSSIRNMRFIGWDRIVLWWILAISSLPIHLLYNSVVFETTGGNLYNTAAVSSASIDSGNRHFNQPGDGNGDYPGVFNYTSFKNISKSECIQRYSTAKASISGFSYLSNSGSVVAVSSDSPEDIVFAFGTAEQDILWTGNFTFSTQNFSSFEDANFIEAILPSKQENVPVGLLWVCVDMLTLNADEQFVTDKCNLTSLEANTSAWTINGFPVSYCLADQQPVRCTVQFSTTILIVVVLSNVLKVTCMLYAIVRVEQKVLVVIGDAIASFLASEDPTTLGMCLSSKNDAQSGLYSELKDKEMSKGWQQQRCRWFRSVSWKRWSSLTILCVLLLGSSIFLLRLGIHDDTSQDYPTELNQFGAETSLTSSGESVDLYTRSGSSLSVIQLVLIANTPQLLVSLAYFQLSAIVALMIGNAEWASFAFKKKSLRVSSPELQQRKTYLLQFPYKYSIPLLVVMTTLHWAISQSIFLVRFVPYQEGVQVDEYGNSSLGWTSGALLLSIILGGLVFLACVGFGILKRYPPGLPLLGGCSLVISAACHARPDDENVELGPVQWGVIGLNEDGTSHCGFASKDVRMPYEGEICA